VTERDGSAEQARQNLMGKLSGKAKEVAGAVTGNDSLTAEGRLQQAEVTARQEAATDEAVADAQRTDAAKEIAEKTRLAAQHKQVAASQADADKARAEQEKATEQAHAERAAEQKVAGDRAVAEVQAKQHKRRGRRRVPPGPPLHRRRPGKGPTRARRCHRHRSRR